MLHFPGKRCHGNWALILPETTVSHPSAVSPVISVASASPERVAALLTLMLLNLEFPHVTSHCRQSVSSFRPCPPKLSELIVSVQPKTTKTENTMQQLRYSEVLELFLTGCLAQAYVKLIWFSSTCIHVEYMSWYISWHCSSPAALIGWLIVSLSIVTLPRLKRKVKVIHSCTHTHTQR